MKVSNDSKQKVLNKLVYSTSNNILIEVDKLKYEKRALTTQGDIKSYSLLTMNIQEHGVLVPIVIDNNHNVLSGSRRVIIAKSLNIQKIPAVVVEKKLDENQRRKLEIDLHLSARRMTYLETSLLVYKLHEESQAKTKTVEELAEYLKCDIRSIQSKKAHMKSFHKLSQKIQSILYAVDSQEGIERIVFNYIHLLDLNLNFVEKEILSLKAEDLTNNNLKSILSKLLEQKNETDRNEKIDMQMATIEQQADNALLEIMDLAPIKKVEANNEQLHLKMVLRYEIKKLFKQAIDEKEMQEAESIKATYNIDLNKEIELIQSLLH